MYSKPFGLMTTGACLVDTKVFHSQLHLHSACSYVVPTWNVSCLLENRSLCMLSQWRGGGPRCFSHPAHVCYSGSTISLECSACCQRQVTTEECTHKRAETLGWLKKAWMRGHRASLRCDCGRWQQIHNASSIWWLKAQMFQMMPTVMK